MFILPKLEYDYKDLEPYIDGQTMLIHHTKHHQTYVDNLNKVIEGKEKLQGMTIEDILKNIESFPAEIRQKLVNFGGGHANHDFFWKIMAPSSNKNVPHGEVKKSLESLFGSIEGFKEKFTERALGVFGSGWAFLIMTPEGKLELKRQSFQNSPLMHGSLPILGIDVWEHAYYLKYQNRRDEYLKAWWNVVNWVQVEANFVQALKK